MNFLAHLFLSPKNKDVIFGNFIADAVKGKVFDTYAPEIQRGILLHRVIDLYTDQHSVFKRSVERLTPNYRRYSGIIVDIYYDHFLSKYWNEYRSTVLKDEVLELYQLLVRRFNILPPRSKRLLPFMIVQNWLVNYSNLKDLRRVFKGMSRRTSNSSGMVTAVDDLEEHYQLYENEFREFFPEIIKYIKTSEYYL
ncbi:MAG: DUF479 domain-containing protein [Bacteroidetes bacterium]|nr:DUF479 domain-containing protein [Bacteroidota bacterium]